jgi:hypothetical protein
LTELLGDLGDLDHLDQVSDPNIVEVIEADSAFKAGFHLFRVVLEAFEGGDFSSENLDPFAEEPYL